MNGNKIQKHLTENAKKKNNGALYDERQMQNNATSMTIIVVFAMLFDVIMMLIHFINHNTEKAYPYLAQLLVICAAFGLASLGNKEHELPKILSGNKVSPEKSRKAFFKRFFACFIDTVVTVAVVTVFNIHIDGKVTGTIVSDTVIFFVIFMLLEVGICEKRVHSYRKFQKKLDEEENDIEE